jgi:ATP-dependent helicase HrpB
LNRPERNTPEIQRSDLAEVVLLLHSLGIRRAAEFDWLDRPDPPAVQRAEDLLRTLGALGREAPPAATAEQRAGEIHCDLTATGRQMLKLPMHPRYSRLLVEAAKFGCVPGAALCAALVSGRDLLLRLGREDQHIKTARELFEASRESDFYTLLRAFQFAKRNHFSVETCRRYGIQAQTARQVEQTFEQLLRIAQRQGLVAGQEPGGGKSEVAGTEAPESARTAEVAAAPSRTLGPPAPCDGPLLCGVGTERGQECPPSTPSEDCLPRCLMTGFIDQLCRRRDQGTLECDLTEGRQGTLMRESVVESAPLFVAATIREVAGRGPEKLTLLGLATAVKREWIQETFPEQITAKVEHLYDRTHKRVAPLKLLRFRDLVIHQEHQRAAEPKASGLCLAEAHRQGCFELPLFNHEIKQFIARANLVAAVTPELEFPAFDEAAILACLARAFEGLSLAKEAQATPLRQTFVHHLGQDRLGWLDELAPVSLPWPAGRKLKLLYSEQARDQEAEPAPPELQAKLQECFALREHPRVCDGRLPVKLWLCAPDGKRLEATLDWPAFKASRYPALKPMLLRKYPGLAWG